MPVDRSENGAIIQVKWHGIVLEVVHTTSSFAGMYHIEITSCGRVPLPATETGYRSLFIFPERVAEYDDAGAYVLAWLDHDAQSAEWKRYEIESRQLGLF